MTVTDIQKPEPESTETREYEVGFCHGRPGTFQNNDPIRQDYLCDSGLLKSNN